MVKTRTRRLRKTKLLGGLVLGFVVSFCALKVALPQLDFAPEVDAKVTQPDFSQLKLEQGAFSILVNGRTILEQEGEKVWPTASTVKMVLALAVMEKRPFGVGEAGGTLVLGRDDYEFYRFHLNTGGSRTQVEVGETLTERQALEALLIKSSNNMADTLAVWAFGGLEEYRSYAHKMLMGWGLQDVTIGDDASGLSPTTTASARDLAIIGQKVLANPVLAGIVGQSEAELPVAGKIENTNYLLERDKNIVGVKSGFTDEAGRNFVLGAKNGKDTIIVSVLGVDKKGDATGEAYKLYQKAVAAAKDQVVVEKDEAVGRLKPKWLDAEVELYAEEELKADIWAAEGAEFDVKLDTEILGVAGRVGWLELTLPNEVKRVPVYVKEEIGSPDWWWRVWN